MDRWDIVGMAGAAIVAGGIWGLAGPAWSAVFAGGLVMALYVVRELRR
jgi:hypothetical protein